MTDRRRRTSLRLALLLALPALAGCFQDPPPSDFDPVPWVDSSRPDNACADLDGLTVDLALDPLAKAIADRPAPAAHGLPRVLVFRRGVTHLELWWAVPREDLLAFARETRASDPQRYARWRRLVLRGTLEPPRAWDHEGWLAEVAALGPPGPVYAGIVGYGCEDGWSRARDQGITYGDDEDTEREIWLARDRRGDLLVRDATVRLKPYSGWAGQTAHLRIGVSSTWRRIPSVASVSTDRLAEDELPVPLTVAGKPASDPGQATRACTDAPERLVGFSQRLQALLPTGAELVRFVPEAAPAGEPRDCALLVVEVAVEGPTEQSLATLYTLVRRDPDVHRLAVLAPPEGAQKPQRRLRVTLQ